MRSIQQECKKHISGCYGLTLGEVSGEISFVNIAKPPDVPITIDGLKEGIVLGKYKLVEQLGEGSFGIVWKALDTGLDNDERAIKFIRPVYRKYINLEKLRMTTLKNEKGQGRPPLELHR